MNDIGTLINKKRNSLREKRGERDRDRVLPLFYELNNREKNLSSKLRFTELKIFSSILPHIVPIYHIFSGDSLVVHFQEDHIGIY